MTEPLKAGWYWVLLKGEERPQPREWREDYGITPYWDYLVGADPPEIEKVICPIPSPGPPMAELFPPTLDDMIHCAAHELSYRERVYPRRVAAGVMPQALADREITRMRAILERLCGDKREGRE
jgi:hypothetical protein